MLTGIKEKHGDEAMVAAPTLRRTRLSLNEPQSEPKLEWARNSGGNFHRRHLLSSGDKLLRQGWSSSLSVTATTLLSSSLPRLTVTARLGFGGGDFFDGGYKVQLLDRVSLRLPQATATRGGLDYSGKEHGGTRTNGEAILTAEHGAVAARVGSGLAARTAPPFPSVLPLSDPPPSLATLTLLSFFSSFFH
ncbi:uncharacterized protein DS421_14g469330 [Arachis hypogaea]|nr:uncharacterized protein DS421_14g469330 [Arachis hypogaea]